MHLFRPPILFHWSMYLFLCPFHSVLITIVLHYSLKSGSVMPPALFFFLRIALATQGLLYCLWWIFKTSGQIGTITKTNTLKPKGFYSKYFSLTIKMCVLGLPWWRSGWESACQCRGHGVEPWSGKIPHAAEQLSPWATTTEPARLEPVLCNKRGCDSERPAHRDEEWPLLAATRESPRTETKTQHSQK